MKKYLFIISLSCGVFGLKASDTCQGGEYTCHQIYYSITKAEKSVVSHKKDYVDHLKVNFQNRPTDYLHELDFREQRLQGAISHLVGMHDSYTQSCANCYDIGKRDRETRKLAAASFKLDPTICDLLKDKESVPLIEQFNTCLQVAKDLSKVPTSVPQQSWWKVLRKKAS